MTTHLIIARHGNTFTSDQIPTRVGANTDLDLVDSGRKQASKMGEYLKNNDLLPDIIFTSHLKRTVQMADIICSDQAIAPQRIQLDMFNEIDYGPDENKPEDEVVARIGQAAIKVWDENAVVPEGWNVDPQRIILDWQVFGHEVAQNHADKIILVITSNGIARFAPYLTGDFESFKKEHNIKISTGALCLLAKEGAQEHWNIEEWNKRP